MLVPAVQDGRTCPNTDASLSRRNKVLGNANKCKKAGRSVHMHRDALSFSCPLLGCAYLVFLAFLQVNTPIGSSFKMDIQRDNETFNLTDVNEFARLQSHKKITATLQDLRESWREESDLAVWKKYAKAADWFLRWTACPHTFVLEVRLQRGWIHTSGEKPRRATRPPWPWAFEQVFIGALPTDSWQRRWVTTRWSPRPKHPELKRSRPFTDPLS